MEVVVGLRVAGLSEAVLLEASKTDATMIAAVARSFFTRSSPSVMPREF